MDRQKLIELINAGGYKELDEIIAKDNSNDSFIEFCNAFIHEREDYSGYSMLIARSIYEKAIKREDSIPQTFYYFAIHLLGNNNKPDRDLAVEVLRSGIKKYSSSERMVHQYLALLEGEEVREFVVKEIDFTKLNSTEIVLPYLLSNCFKMKDYELFKWLDKNDVLRIYKKTEVFEIALIIGFLYYDIGNSAEAESYFTHVSSYDYKGDSRKYALLGKVLNAGNDKLEDALKNLPMIYPFEPYMYYIDDVIQYIDFEKYLNELFDNVIEENIVKMKKELQAKIRGIRGYLRFDSESNGGISDLKYAIKYIQCKEYYYALNMLYYNKHNYKETFKYGIEYLNLASPEERLEEYCNFVIPDERNGLSELIAMIKKDEYKFYKSKDIYVKIVVAPVIKVLFENKEYSEVCDLSKRYRFEDVASIVGFEIAYAYEKNDERELSKKYYNYIINEEGLVSIAALNNLAIIYSEEGNYEEAIELRERAVVISSGDSECKRRLRVEIDNYNNVKNVMKEEIAAVSYLKDENGWALCILKNFFEHKDDNGFIVCSYKLLPKYMQLGKIKADEMINYFIEKLYLRKAKNNEHKIDTQSTVYKVNDRVYQELHNIYSSESFFGEILNNLKELTPNKIFQLGYTDELIEKLESLDDERFKEMIIRDIKENLLALITKSYKSSLVITGSIVEAIIMYQLNNKNIDRYVFTMKGGKEQTIKLKEMSLSQLISAAEYYKVFSQEALKHADAIRGYRNLIHPGVEVRKSQETPMVTEDNVYLSWMVLKKIIIEL